MEGGPNSSYTFGGAPPLSSVGPTDRQMSVMTTDSYYGPLGGPPVSAEGEDKPFSGMPVSTNSIGDGAGIVGLGLDGESEGKVSSDESSALVSRP